MTVIDEKPVPLYVKECSECGSKFTYKKAEVGFGNNIYCPVCGVSLRSSFQKIDVNTVITGDTKNDLVEVVRCKDCKFYTSYCDIFKPDCPITEDEKHNGKCSYIGKKTGVFTEVNEKDFCSYGKRRETE